MKAVTILHESSAKVGLWESAFLEMSRARALEHDS